MSLETLLNGEFSWCIQLSPADRLVILVVFCLIIAHSGFGFKIGERKYGRSTADSEVKRSEGTMQPFVQQDMTG